MSRIPFSMLRTMTNLARNISDWFTAADIERLRSESILSATMRFSRGNTSIQAGRLMTKSDLDKLRLQGNRAHRKIKKG